MKKTIFLIWEDCWTKSLIALQLAQKNAARRGPVGVKKK